MYTIKDKLTWQGGVVVVLALVSLVMPVAAGFLRREPVAPFADPIHLNYYRQTVAALILGLVCAIGTFIGTGIVPASGLRKLSIVLASGGMLISAYLLWILIGSCGAQVLWAGCQP